MVNSQDAATRYRNRAEELRTIAESVTDPQRRKELERWADEYEKLIDQLAEAHRLKG